jgi:uncharacterized protein YdaU (DUF1376 family)
MAEFSALPLWTDAFLADTTHLDALETGAYLLLLMASWRTEDGGLPNDDKILARYAKVNGRQWSAIKKTVLRFFDLRADGHLIQKRLEKERDFLRTRSSSQSERGVKGASARWLKHKESLLANAHQKQSERIAKDVPDECPADGKPITPATATVERTDRGAPSGRTPDEKPPPVAARADERLEAQHARGDDPGPMPDFLKRPILKAMPI